jgi:hypothetical protein
MAIPLFTTEQHRAIVKNLVAHSRQFTGTRNHDAGPEYTSLMVCFLLNNMGLAESLLRLHDSLGEEWFPVTAGYVITRSMFEVDVTAHYISLDPIERSERYIKYGHVLKKRRLDAVTRHRTSGNATWREAMELVWKHDLSAHATEIDVRYAKVRPLFEPPTKKKNTKPFKNWSGKSLREMALDVHHEEAYDIFYADLSSFAHADVRLADRFLRSSGPELAWSQRASEADVGFVFRYAAIFLTCYLEFFGQQFNLWDKSDIEKCWILEERKADS